MIAEDSFEEMNAWFDELVVLTSAWFHQTAWACSHVSAVAGSTWLKQFENAEVRRCTSLKTRSTAFLKPCCCTR